jgi:hypothetical protein
MNQRMNPPTWPAFTIFREASNESEPGRVFMHFPCTATLETMSIFAFLHQINSAFFASNETRGYSNESKPGRVFIK